MQKSSWLMMGLAALSSIPAIAGDVPQTQVLSRGRAALRTLAMESKSPYQDLSRHRVCVAMARVVLSLELLHGASSDSSETQKAIEKAWDEGAELILSMCTNPEVRPASPGLTLDEAPVLRKWISDTKPIFGLADAKCD